MPSAALARGTPARAPAPHWETALARAVGAPLQQQPLHPLRPITGRVDVPFRHEVLQLLGVVGGGPFAELGETRGRFAGRDWTMAPVILPLSSSHQVMR